MGVRRLDLGVRFKARGGRDPKSQPKYAGDAAVQPLCLSGKMLVRKLKPGSL